MPTKAQRAKMTEEEKQRVREIDRERYANRTEEQKQRYNAQKRQEKREERANWTEERRQQSLDYARRHYTNLTEEQKQQLYEKKRQRYANRSEEAKKLRTEYNVKRWANMTKEQKREEYARRGPRKHTPEQLAEKCRIEKERYAKWLLTATEEQKQHRRAHKTKRRQIEDAKLSMETVAIKYMLQAAKRRNGKKGRKGKKLVPKLPFNITVEHLHEIWPEDNKCPALGISLERNKISCGGIDSSPSLDKLVPERGYTIGNVKIVSFLANRIKTNANASQVLAVGKWLESEERERAST